MPLRITNGFDKQSDADLVVTSTAIKEAMTGNTYFPTPVPSLALLTTAINNYEGALAIAVNGSNYDKAKKNEKRAALTETLHLLGNFVLFTAAGDRLVAQSSGFPIAKDPAPAPPLTRPENLKLDDGDNSGEIKLTFDAVAGARSYIYQFTPDPLLPSSIWQHDVGTTKQNVFSGLTPGQKYWCRVVAVGTNGQSITSDAVSRIAL